MCLNIWCDSFFVFTEFTGRDLNGALNSVERWHLPLAIDQRQSNPVYETAGTVEWRMQLRVPAQC